MEIVLDSKNTNGSQLQDPEIVEYYKNIEAREIWIDVEIDDTLMDVVKQIRRYNQEDKDIPIGDRKPIKIFLDTVGGDVAVMWAIINAIRISKTPVYTIACAKALSAGSHILASGHKRYALPGSMVLIHNGYAGYSGTTDQVESIKRYFDKLEVVINDYLISRTKITKKLLKTKAAGDWYLNAEEALQYGIVDKIIDSLEEV